jgi:biopolymer transport protein ExbD
MRIRRLRKEPAALEITAFINLVVVLVPFLLSTAVFSRLAVMDLALPARGTGAPEALKAEGLQLEVVVRANAIEVGDRIGGPIERIEPRGGGAPDAAALAALSGLMVSLKAQFPQVADATVLAEPNIPYDTLVQVMDAVRATRAGSGRERHAADLFPRIAIGDAPVVTVAAASKGPK